MALTPSEKKLIEHAKKAIVKYNKLRQSRGGIDTIYSFVMSDSGKMYDGACLETSLPNANVCAERHAIAQMVLKESYKAKIKHIVVADPVPSVQKTSTTPCGICRSVIWDRGTPSTTVLCVQYIRHEKNWTFHAIQKHTIKTLFPFPYEPVEWD
tara:strand:- start:1006 stop:1467 length:462 start_codon:yes stop_codon:yes gene_type:complete